MIGGCVGVNGGTIQDCEYVGTITTKASRKNGYCSTNMYVGGIVGRVESGATVSRCSAEATIEKTNTNESDIYLLGVIVGQNYGNVNECVAAGTIAHQGKGSYVYLGGVVGENFSGVYACFAAVDISESSSGGTRKAGGLVGSNQANASVKASVCTGSITADALSSYGYAIGHMADGATAFKCYYSSEATLTVGGEVKAEGTCTEGTAKTTAECQSAALLLDTLYWDSEVWEVGNGIPTLKHNG